MDKIYYFGCNKYFIVVFSMDEWGIFILLYFIIFSFVFDCLKLCVFFIVNFGGFIFEV